MNIELSRGKRVLAGVAGVAGIALAGCGTPESESSGPEAPDASKMARSVLASVIENAETGVQVGPYVVVQADGTKDVRPYVANSEGDVSCDNVGERVQKEGTPYVYISSKNTMEKVLFDPDESRIQTSAKATNVNEKTVDCVAFERDVDTFSEEGVPVVGVFADGEKQIATRNGQ